MGSVARRYVRETFDVGPRTGLRDQPQIATRSASRLPSRDSTVCEPFFVRRRPSLGRTNGPGASDVPSVVSVGTNRVLPIPYTDLAFVPRNRSRLVRGFRRRFALFPRRRACDSTVRSRDLRFAHVRGSFDQTIGRTPVRSNPRHDRVHATARGPWFSRVRDQSQGRANFARTSVSHPVPVRRVLLSSRRSSHRSDANHVFRSGRRVRYVRTQRMERVRTFVQIRDSSHVSRSRSHVR